MDEHLKQELIARFRAYLDSDPQCEGARDEVDQFSLLAELSALKSEVRLESRQFRSALDDFKNAFSALDGSIQAISHRLERIEAGGVQDHNVDIKSVIMGLVEVYDRLSGLFEYEHGHEISGILALVCKGVARRYQAHIEGLKMLFQRIVDLLALCGVEPVEPAGQRFDPHIMRAVDYASGGQSEDGVVCAVHRTGFLWNGKVLRPADVVVTRSCSGGEDE